MRRQRARDGVVLVGHRHRPELFALLARARAPYVCTYTFRRGPHPCVGFDHAAAMSRLVAHLTGFGHRRFGVITTSIRHDDRIAQRLRGATGAIAAAALPAPVVVEMAYTLRDGRTGLRAPLARAPAITAVVCTTDIHAVDALAEARLLGLGVPAPDA